MDKERAALAGLAGPIKDLRLATYSQHTLLKGILQSYEIAHQPLPAESKIPVQSS